MSYYDDWFDEPTEFEQQVDDFKAALMGSVKEEIKLKIQALEKENEELREFRDKKDEYERVMRDKIAECNRMVENAKRDAQMSSLKSILGENLITAYRVHTVSKRTKKCDRCDDRRKISYKTPLGFDRTEDCVCERRVYVHEPREVKLVRFYATSKRIAEMSDPSVNLYYERTEENRDYDRYELTSNVYKGEDFEKVNWYYAVFLNEEKCREYCDWLNKQSDNSTKEYLEKWGLELEEEYKRF